MKSNSFQVICIKNCNTFGGGHFFKNKKYKCQIIDDYAYIYDEDNNMVKIEIKPLHHKFGFPTFFSSLNEQRKNKLIKINKINKINKIK